MNLNSFSSSRKSVRNPLPPTRFPNVKYIYSVTFKKICLAINVSILLYVCSRQSLPVLKKINMEKSDAKKVEIIIAIFLSWTFYVINCEIGVVLLISDCAVGKFRKVREV